ncbi:MAG: hypothetical protein ACLUSP_02150 [Christensenellales bacterium]
MIDFEFITEKGQEKAIIAASAVITSAGRTKVVKTFTENIMIAS